MQSFDLHPGQEYGYCPDCLAGPRKEIGASLAEMAVAHNADFFDQTGTRPTHTPEATIRRQRSNQRQIWEQETWERDHHGEEQNPDRFRTEILSKLESVTLNRIAAVTGMSTSAASKIRAGRRIPHPRHWEALAQLVFHS
jgi:hypothetical protein